MLQLHMQSTALNKRNILTKLTFAIVTCLVCYALPCCSDIKNKTETQDAGRADREGTDRAGSQSDVSLEDEGSDSARLSDTGLDTEDRMVCDGDHEPSQRRIAVESGTVVGIVDGETDAFLGIPFAKPPVGDLRWASPQPLGCFVGGVLQADHYGSRCTQLTEDQQSTVGEEDCLQLNIWTPSSRSEPLPVLFFIHGGGHSIGSGIEPLCRGAELSAFGEGSVVVTTNYRLGALGFLLHADIPTNLGLRDQVAALGWVQRNIAAFGGDPSRVMVFGESAGAVDACALMGIPEADGLFQRAIVQSGSCRQLSRTVYAPVSENFITHSGCAGEPDELACLRALPADEIVRTEPTGFPDVAGLKKGWSPFVDGDFLPRATEQRWAAGESGGISAVVIGSNRDETAASVPLTLTERQYELLVRSVAPLPSLAEQVLALYPVSDYTSPTEAYIALTSELKFNCTARRAASAASVALDSRLYMFSYDEYRTLAVLGQQPRATHGLELVPIFGNFDSLSVGGFNYRPNDTDRQISEEMMARWTGFARSGVPAAPDAVSWPVMDSDNQSDGDYLVLDTPSHLGDGEYPDERCDFWDGFLSGL
jgi:para-nitrobenzyl esterase